MKIKENLSDYYKRCPDKFCEEYLGIKLTPLQRILVKGLNFKGVRKDEYAIGYQVGYNKALYDVETLLLKGKDNEN